MKLWWCSFVEAYPLPMMRARFYGVAIIRCDGVQLDAAKRAIELGLAPDPSEMYGAEMPEAEAALVDLSDIERPTLLGPEECARYDAKPVREWRAEEGCR